MFARAAFVPGSAFRHAKRGANTVIRMRTFVVRLILSLQMAALDGLLAAMDRMRQNFAEGGREGTTFASAIAFRHSWDETRQMLRDPPQSHLARQSRQRVARTILVQRCMVHTSIATQDEDGQTSQHSRCESFIVPPLEMAGKTAGHLLSGLARGCPFPLLDVAAVRAMAQRTSATILGFCADSASSNRRLLKHLVAQSIEESWPESVLIDGSQICLIHQLHRLKVELVEVHTLVSLMFCLSKLVRAGTVTPLISDHLAHRIESQCVRRVGPPPPEAAARSRRLLDMIHGLDSPHHVREGRRGKTKSRLLQDLEEVLRLDNGDLSDRSAGLVHHCHGSDGRPCCSSLQQTKERMLSAYLNLFTCHSLPVATLSRWTHVLIVAGTLCTGFACRDLYLGALVQGLSADEEAEQVATKKLATVAAGAGDEDLAVEHRARVAKVRRWLALPETRACIGATFLMLRTLESLSYWLMGGEQASPAGTKPGTLPQWTPALPAWELAGRIQQAMTELGEAVRSYTEEGSSPNFFLKGIGVTTEEFSGDQCMRTFRRSMVGASAGINRRLSMRAHSFPLKLWILIAPGIADDDRVACAEEFASLQECCLGAFGRSLRRLCPTAADLMSTVGLTIVRTWMSSIQWSTYACEAEHAACRRLCSGGGGGPSRNWTLVARERIMEEARGIHRQRFGVDPACAPPPPPARGAKRDARAVSPGAIAESPAPPLPNPLSDVPLRAPLSAPPWSASAPPPAEAGGQPAAALADAPAEAQGQLVDTSARDAAGGGAEAQMLANAGRAAAKVAYSHRV